MTISQDPNSAQIAHEAALETTSRLIAALVNEGLVAVTVEDLKDVSYLVLKCHSKLINDSTRILVSLREGTRYELWTPAAGITIAAEDCVSAISPELNQADIVGNIIIQHLSGREEVVYRPDEVFDVVSPWICDNKKVVAQVRAELQSSADNQEKWLHYALSHPAPTIGAPLIEWEQGLIRGHLTHAMHRTFYAIPPVKPVQIDNIENFLNPEIIIISVPRDCVQLNGPFEASLKPLLIELNISAASTDRVLLPCYAEQLHVIRHSLGNDVEVVTSKNENVKLHGQRQSSIRSASISGFPFHVKMSLSYVIGGSKRSLPSWVTESCIEVSQLLHEIATDPEIMSDTNLLWIARKVAAISSPDADLSVMLREDHEQRARELGQCLVLPATLFEVGGEDRVAHVVNLFGLDTLDKCKNWFREYTRVLLKAVIPPLLSGVGLEAHMQNTLLRFEVGSNIPCGFVYRDMAGLRLHVPTLARRGVTLKPVSGALLTNDIDVVRVNVYHNIVASHLGWALQAMGLAWNGGWDIVREEMVDALTNTPRYKAEAAELLRFMLQPLGKRKAFFRMKLAGGISGQRVYFCVPNPLVAP
ncbi:hypothetical protein TWF694_003155 [Orbilia ellipsospora]|uniref:Siderophore synthetase component n=1 Tax=Orbilia ellipsospora TaxID=2528407 RepID=A0AAV9X1Y2_9PEZI